MPLVLDEYGYQFELGKAKMLRDGADLLVISSGIMTMRALEVAKALETDKVDVAALHVADDQTAGWRHHLRKPARTGRMVVVAENHSVIGGLGEAAAGLLLRSGVRRSSGISACQTSFSSPPLPTLHDRYGISAEAMSTEHQGLARISSSMCQWGPWRTRHPLAPWGSGAGGGTRRQVARSRG